MKKCPKCKDNMVKIFRNPVVNVAKSTPIEKAIPKGSYWWMCNNDHCDYEEKA